MNFLDTFAGKSLQFFVSIAPSPPPPPTLEDLSACAGGRFFLGLNGVAGRGSPRLEQPAPALRLVRIRLQLAVVELEPVVKSRRYASPSSQPVTALRFCPDGHRLALGHDGYGCVLDLTYALGNGAVQGRRSS